MTEDDKLFLNRLAEKVQRVQRRYVPETTDFLEPRLQLAAQQYLEKSGQPYLFWGGYEGAERQRLVICSPYEAQDETAAEVSLLRLTGKLDYVKADHRDFLGAILSLGLKREKFGDLLLAEQGCYLAAAEDIADYVLSNCPKVKGVPLHGERISTAQWQPPETKFKAISASVSSLRLDALVAHGFGLSRNDAVALLQGNRVKVNHRDIADKDYACQFGDLLSVRGKGKLKVGEIGGQTKKGKIKVELLRYI